MRGKLRVYRLSDFAMLVITEEEARKIADKLKGLGFVEVIPNKHYERWTPEECERLRELAEMGYGWERIAMELGRTVKAVKNKARKLGIKRWRRWSSSTDSGQLRIDSYHIDSVE